MAPCDFVPPGEAASEPDGCMRFQKTLDGAVEPEPRSGSSMGLGAGWLGRCGRPSCWQLHPGMDVWELACGGTLSRWRHISVSSTDVT